MSNEIVTVEPTEIEQIQMGSLTAQSSQSIVRMASTIATELASIVESQKLYTVISGKKFVQVEGWTTMGAMLGITPKERQVIVDENGDYEAHVDLIRNSDGVVVGGASSICGTDEKTWASRNRYARRSMAVTRATGKAFRLSYSWIMRLAGYEPTPFEEMPIEGEYHETPKSSGTNPAKAPQNWGELYTLANDNQLSVTLDEAKALYKKHNGDLGAAWNAIQALNGGEKQPQEPETMVECRTPDQLKAALAKRADTIGEYSATDPQRNLLGALLSEYYQDDQKRHTVQLWLTGSSSTKDMDGAIVKAMLDWLKPTKDDSGAYVIDDTAKTELSHVLTIALMDEGQEELL